MTRHPSTTNDKTSTCEEPIRRSQHIATARNLKSCETKQNFNFRPLGTAFLRPSFRILAPLLFLLYQNNLSNTINHSKIATFADDTKIYKVINTEADAYAMENDLANFQSSSTKANLLNTDKCKALHITRKHNKINHTYKLQDATLKTTDCERDLGVWASSTLTWSKQVLHQCAHASQSLGYIRRSTIKIKAISVRRILYLTLVRSHLAYASQVWAPQYVDLIKRTERVQKTCVEIHIGPTVRL